MSARVLICFSKYRGVSGWELLYLSLIENLIEFNKEMRGWNYIYIYNSEVRGWELCVALMKRAECCLLITVTEISNIMYKLNA